MTAFAGYRVDLGELDAAMTHLVRTHGVVERLAEDLDRQMALLHDTWTGLAASAHLAAHDAWERRRRELSLALAALASAAVSAHDGYAEAATANAADWRRL